MQKSSIWAFNHSFKDTYTYTYTYTRTLILKERKKDVSFKAPNLTSQPPTEQLNNSHRPQIGNYNQANFEQSKAYRFYVKNVFKKNNRLKY